MILFNWSKYIEFGITGHFGTKGIKSTVSGINLSHRKFDLDQDFFQTVSSSIHYSFDLIVVFLFINQNRAILNLKRAF